MLAFFLSYRTTAIFFRISLPQCLWSSVPVCTQTDNPKPSSWLQRREPGLLLCWSLPAGMCAAASLQVHRISRHAGNIKIVARSCAKQCWLITHLDIWGESLSVMNLVNKRESWPLLITETRRERSCLSLRSEVFHFLRVFPCRLPSLHRTNRNKG